MTQHKGGWLNTLVATASWPTLIATGVAVILVGIVGATIRAILTGQLVPRSVLDDANARADKWEAAWEKSQEIVGAFDGRLTALAEATELNTQLLSSLVERARR